MAPFRPFADDRSGRLAERNRFAGLRPGDRRREWPRE
jgi:hypothetical protein